MPLSGELFLCICWSWAVRVVYVAFPCYCCVLSRHEAWSTVYYSCNLFGLRVFWCASDAVSEGARIFLAVTWLCCLSLRFSVRPRDVFFLGVLCVKDILLKDLGTSVCVRATNLVLLHVCIPIASVKWRIFRPAVLEWPWSPSSSRWRGYCPVEKSDLREKLRGDVCAVVKVPCSCQ